MWSSGNAGQARNCGLGFIQLTPGNNGLNFIEMALIRTKPKPATRRVRGHRQLSGGELALLLQKADSAKTPEEKKRLRREFMRGFYGDQRADCYA